MKYNWQLYHWHVELSAKCTLKCPRCPRTEQPATAWTNKEFTLAEFQQSFTEQFIKDNVLRFTFCGDIGDPIYCRDFLSIVRYIKTVKPTCHIFTITNGSYKKAEWWEELAVILNEYDTVNFSVDGFDNETNNLYRVNSDWDSIMTGMSILGKKSKAHVVWASIIFKFNQDHMKDIEKLAKDQGCDKVQWTKSTKFGSKYNAYGIDDPLEPREEYISDTHRYDRITVDISKRTQPIEDYMKKNYEMWLNTLPKGNIMPLCLVGNRGMYVSADGAVHPCSWVSFPFTSMSDGNKTIDYERSFFAKHRDELSIKKYTISEVLNNPLWQKLFDSWRNDTWVECNLKCKKNLVDYNYAVGYETN